MAAVDLKSCYNRIAHSPAYLAMCSFGIPHEPITSMFKTLQKNQHKTKTVHGVSECSFGGIENGFKAAPQGVGQGNRTGPSIWAIVSSKMFEVLHKQGLASKIHCLISKEVLELCGFAFVDNSDIIAVSNSENNLDNRLTQMQEVLDQWEKAAKVTGGAIEPRKCWVYIVHFEWDKNRWKYGKTPDRKLYALDSSNNRKEVQAISSSQAENMLGVFLAPDGNDKHQINHMLDKAIQIGECTRTNHM